MNSKNRCKDIRYQNSLIINTRGKILENVFGARYRDYRRDWENTKLDGIEFPLHIDIMLQDSCNMHCTICHDRKRSGDKLPIDLLKKVFKESAIYRLASCSFGLDSEALYDKEYLFFAIDLAKKSKCMDIIVRTNGLLLDKETSKKIISSGVTMVGISLDAVTNETYSKIRNNSHLNDIESNIIDFLRIRDQRKEGLPKIRLSFCNTAFNAHEAKLFVEKWENVVDQVDIQNFIAINKEKYIGDGIKIKDMGGCQDPFRRLGILANGDVQCCCNSFRSDDIIIGNVAEESLFDIWNGTRMERIRNAFRNDLESIPNYCKLCLDSRYQYNS